MLITFMAWAVASVVLAVRKGWMRSPVPVRWRLNLFEDQVLMACGILLSGATASLVATALGARQGEELKPAISLAALLASSAVTIGTWWTLSRNAMARHVEAAGTKTTRTRALMVGVTSIAMAWPVVALTTRLGEALQVAFGGPAVPEIAHRTLDQLRANATDPFAWTLALAVITLTPWTEELLWRGAVQQGLKSAGLPRAAALPIASALFALVHWNAVPTDARAGAIPALLVLGLLFGWLFERTGRLLAPIAAHATFNAANLILFSTLPG